MNAVTYPRSFPVSGPISLSVRTRAGSIRVSAADVDEAVVDLQPAKAGDQDALALIDRAHIEHRDNTLSVEVSSRSIGPSLLREPAINVQITVPSVSTVEARSGSAHVQLSGRLGDVSAKTGSGNIVVRNCADASLKTGSGDIRATDVAGLEAHSGSGDIVVESASGEVVVDTASGNARVDQVMRRGEIKTASGDVEIGAVEAFARLKTSSGDIRIRRAHEGEVEAKTASGDVTIGVTMGTAAKLDCSSASGRIRSELDPADAPAETDRTILVTARTASGSITVTRAP